MDIPALPKLPAHISQSEDKVFLTCTKCFATVNLTTDPNYRAFLSDHVHPPPAPSHAKAKPWPTYE